MVHLGVQHPFGQGFLQIVEQTIRIESRLGVGAGQQLVEKGIRNTGFFASRHGRAPLLPSCPTPHEIPDSPPVIPIGPVAPVAPSTPAVPVAPVAPSTPAAPVAPVAPVAPATPAAPVAPAAPV